eukprot:COSAG05_NODE_958_length_6426_cov_7.214003_7_plen_329_part_00
MRHVIVGAAEPVVPSEEPGAALSMRWQEQNTTYATRIRNITSTDLMLGCAFNASQGGNPDKECCIATIMDALRWNFSFDTAPLYRDSEEVLGEAFRAAVANGADIDLLARQVWTKVGLRTGGTWNMNPDKCQWVTHGGATKQTARASVEESCRRLGLPSLAGVRFHDIPSGELSTTGELVEAATAPGGMLEGLRELRTEGVIREVSLGMNVNGGKAGDSSAYGQPETVLQLLRSAPPGTFDSALISGGWNLLNQDAFEVLVECEKMGVAVHIAGIYNGGMITVSTLPCRHHAGKPSPTARKLTPRCALGLRFVETMNTGWHAKCANAV